MNAITPPADVAPADAPVADAPAADAMTAAEVMAALTEIARKIGPKTEFGLTVMRRYGGNDVLLTAYVNGMSAAGYLHFDGRTFQEVIAKSRAWAETFIAERRAIVIREMALAIIDLTDQNGAVTDRALAERNFCADDIRELATAACHRASNMANLRPFIVVLT
jgi:hypothetical protein